MKLYYHKTDGGAEYLMDAFIQCPDGSKTGDFMESKYIVRIDGDIEKDAELNVRGSEFFKVVSVGRDDLVNLGFNAKKLTDDEMEEIAASACDGLMNGAYWDAIEAAANSAGLKRSKKLLVSK